MYLAQHEESAGIATPINIYITRQQGEDTFTLAYKEGKGTVESQFVTRLVSKNRA